MFLNNPNEILNSQDKFNNKKNLTRAIYLLTQTGPYYMAQAGVELAGLALTILQPQPPERCDFRHVLPCLAHGAIY